MTTGRPRKEIEERFLGRVLKIKNCWIFPSNGRYSKIKTNPPQKKTVSGHRFAWELFIGPIPEGMQVCHKCNNKHCVNPEHLYLGTAKQNINDAIRDGLIDIHGENNPKAKLTFQEARAIQVSWEKTNILQQKYAVSRSTIQRIRNGKLWKTKQQADPKADTNSPMGRKYPG